MTLWQSIILFQRFDLKPRVLLSYRNCCSIVSIRYLTGEQTLFITKPKYEPIEFFSYVGGIISLWMGFSFFGLFHVIRSCIRFCNHKILINMRRSGGKMIEDHRHMRQMSFRKTGSGGSTGHPPAIIIKINNARYDSEDDDSNPTAGLPKRQTASQLSRVFSLPTGYYKWTKHHHHN